MIILAMDVSLSRTGVAVLDDGLLVATGVIETDAKAPRHVRLGQIANRTVELLRKHDPDIICLETSAAWQKLSRDSRVSIEALAQARAAVMIAAVLVEMTRDRPYRIVEMDSHEAREAVTANWHASKRQVEENLIIRGYPLPRLANGKVDPDVADAVACGLAVWLSERIKLLAREQGHVV